MSAKPGPKMSEPGHDDVLQFVREHPDPFVTTTDVSEEFGSVTRRTINNRLNDLFEKDELAKKHIGRNAVVWFIPE